MNIKGFFCTTVGVVGSLIAQCFGGWSEDVATLIIFMAVDFVLGLIIAGVFHKSNKSETGALNSHAGWVGLCKKATVLLFVLIAYRLDLLLNTDYIKTSVIIGFVANEGISIIENAGIMGVPLPKALCRGIEILKDWKLKKDEDNSTDV